VKKMTNITAVPTPSGPNTLHSRFSSIAIEDELTPITNESVTNAILARAAIKSKTDVEGINFHLGYKGSKVANFKIRSILSELISIGSVEEVFQSVKLSIHGAPKKHGRIQYRIKVLQPCSIPSVMPFQQSVILPAADPILQDEHNANRTGEGIVQAVESNFHIYQRRSLDRIDKLVEQTGLKGHASEVWVNATRSPIYMGAMFDKEGSEFDYANYREEVSLATIKTRLLNHARSWTVDQVHKFQLDFFLKPAPDGKGFVEAERELITIDHILPQSFGGYDHPRNYIIMTKLLNSSLYKDTALDEKLSLIGKSETRKLKLWLQDMHQKQRAAVKLALQQMARREYA
jgi:hypothetical protein